MSFPLVRLNDLSELLPALDACGGWFPNFVLDCPSDPTAVFALASRAAALVDEAHGRGLDRFVLHLRPVPSDAPASSSSAAVPPRRLAELASAAPPLTLSQMWRDPSRGAVVVHLAGTTPARGPRDEPLDLDAAVPLADALDQVRRLVPARPPTGLPGVPTPALSLAERLGFSAADTVVLVNADDLGLCHAANQGVLDAMRNGVCTSASLMVPCPWGRAAAGSVGDLDVGVHLTLNCEWSSYLWQPLTGGASLRDRWGAMRRSVEDVWMHVDPAEAAAEMEAQLVRALDWGVDVTHLDAHMYTAQLTGPLLDAYLDLAVRYRLPLRLRGSGPDGDEPAAAGLRHRAARAGVLTTDHLVMSFDTTDPLAADGLLGRLRPGVTELYLHPAADHPELRSFAADWRRRAADRDALLPGGTVASQLRGSGIHLVGWRELRDLQRRGA